MSTSTLTRSQARVSGAIAANISPVRSTTASLPRITAHSARVEVEAPVHQPSPWLSGSWLVLAGLIMLSLVLSNEIIQLAPLPMSAGLFSWLSLAAQAVWFGPIAYLGFTLLPLLPTINPDQQAEMLIRLLKRARPFLLGAITMLLICEFFLSEATLQTPDQLLTDPYGRALLVRVALLALMLLFTGYTLFFLLPRLQRQTTLLPVVTAEMPARRARTVELAKTRHAIRRMLHALSGLAALSLICLALMNFFAPPVAFPNVNYAALVNQSNTNTVPASPASQTQTVGGLSATLAVAPAHVGATNTVTLTLNNAQGKAVHNATVKLTINMQIMDMGTTSATMNGSGPTYATTINANQAFAMAGTWIVRVEIDQPNQQALYLTFPVAVTQ